MSLATVFLFAFLFAPTTARAEGTNAASASGAPACDSFHGQLAGGSARTRDFAAAALADCPASRGRTARLLEQTIESGDFRQRRIAFRSLAAHLDATSVPFLVRTYYDPALHADERTTVYRYLSRLSEPRWKYALRPIFREGIGSSEPAERLASVLGLGRIDAVEDWTAYLAPLSRGADTDLLHALLTAARLLKTPAALELGTGHLYDPRPRIALAAMELLAVLPGARAREALLLLDYRRLPGDEPSPEQVGRILERTPPPAPRGQAGMESDGTKPATAPHGVLLRRSRLYASPNDRSRITGALARDTIVYVQKRGTTDYRMGDGHRADAWLYVRTARGLSGWIHGDHVYVALCPPGKDSYCARE